MDYQGGLPSRCRHAGTDAAGCGRAQSSPPARPGAPRMTQQLTKSRTRTARTPAMQAGGSTSIAAATQKQPPSAGLSQTLRAYRYSRGARGRGHLALQGRMRAPDLH